MGEGSQFCSKLACDCAIRDHWLKKKICDVMVMEDGFYINGIGVGRAFGEPCLPLAAATRSPTFQDLLDEGEGKTLETWTAIFRHLCDRAKDAKAFASVQGRRAADKVENRGLINFYTYTALKTPKRVAPNSSNSPKCMRYNVQEMDGGEGNPNPNATSGLSSDKMDELFSHLRTSLALVNGELGSQAAEAPYTTVHGGLQRAYAALARFKVLLAFERIKGAISQSIGSRLAVTILTELHGECMMHFSAISSPKSTISTVTFWGKVGRPLSRRPPRHPVGVWSQSCSRCCSRRSTRCRWRRRASRTYVMMHPGGAPSAPRVPRPRISPAPQVPPQCGDASVRYHSSLFGV